MKKQLRRLVAALAMAGAVLVLVPTSAALAADATEEVAPVAKDGAALVLNEPVWTVLVGFALPWLITTITKKAASDRVKAWVSAIGAALAAIAARRVLLPDGTAWLSLSAAADGLVIWLASVNSHERFWKKISERMKTGVLPARGIG